MVVLADWGKLPYDVKLLNGEFRGKVRVNGYFSSNKKNR